MPRKKDTSKGGGPIARIPENSRSMRAQERRFGFPQWAPSSVLHAITTGLFGFDIFRYRYIHNDQENDFIYADDDDDDNDDDDYDDDDIYAHDVTHGPLRPCPRIRELTDQEADKHAEELIDEQRRKDKTERNKRKKLRKKEKKRLEKENAANDILPEEESGTSDPLTNLEENCIIDSNTGADECPESGQTQNETEEVGYDGSSVNNTNNKEETSTAMTEKEDDDHKQDSRSSNSYSAAGSVPKEKCNQRPMRARNKRKTKSVEAKQLKEEKPSVVEKPEAPEKEEKCELNQQNAMDPVTAEYAKRSRDLASHGNIFAASGQFEAAVKCFTDAIKYNPKEFKLFGNRSFCYERMERYESALCDADVALCLEPKWIKGLFRKGKALCGLKRYYEASLIYKEVLQIQGSSVEATQELKRAQTLHLTEMGFTWERSSEALRSHGTLEEAVESLFGDSRPGPGVASASCDNADQAAVEEEEEEDDDDDEGEWTVQQSNRSRAQIRECDALTGSRMKSQSPTPRSRNAVKPELYSVWVGMLAPAVTYATLHELFSRAGTVYSIKMLLEHQCAFVKYTRKEDRDKAIHCIDGLVVEGITLSVQNPYKIHNGLGMYKPATTDFLSHTGLYSKECFFWRTIGCTRPDCTYKHDPKHKNIDQDKVTSKLGNFHL